jgi:rubrerythrin
MRKSTPSCGSRRWATRRRICSTRQRGERRGTDMYDHMAKEADEEGFHDLAQRFWGVAAIE